jgi:ribosome-binding factor A
MRVVRINELIKREISSILHTRFRDSAVRITVSDVETTPDLKAATVFYGVIGGEEEAAAARHFFGKNGAEIRMMVGKVVVMKYLPRLTFRYDDSMERGAHLNEIIDTLDIPEEPKEGK